MKTKLLLLLVLAYCVHTATQHPKDAANTSIAPVAPAATPSGAWMWQEHGPNPLDAGTYYGGYVPGKSVSLTPFSSNGGSIIKAAENMMQVINFTPVAASSGTLTGASPLDERP